jgi:hypothetical protein
MQSLLSALGIYNFSNAFGVRSSAREERLSPRRRLSSKRRFYTKSASLNSFVVPIFPITANEKPREASAWGVPMCMRTTPRRPSE